MPCPTRLTSSTSYMPSRRNVPHQRSVASMFVHQRCKLDHYKSHGLRKAPGAIKAGATSSLYSSYLASLTECNLHATHHHAYNNHSRQHLDAVGMIHKLNDPIPITSINVGHDVEGPRTPFVASSPLSERSNPCRPADTVLDGKNLEKSK